MSRLTLSLTIRLFVGAGLVGCPEQPAPPKSKATETLIAGLESELAKYAAQVDACGATLESQVSDLKARTQTLFRGIQSGMMRNFSNMPEILIAEAELQPVFDVVPEQRKKCVALLEESIAIRERILVALTTRPDDVAASRVASVVALEKAQVAAKKRVEEVGDIGRGELGAAAHQLSELNKLRKSCDFFEICWRFKVAADAGAVGAAKPAPARKAKPSSDEPNPYE